MSERTDPGGGGLTGATGDLTPDEMDGEFVPAELREIEDPATHGDVTASRGSSAPAQRGATGAPRPAPGGRRETGDADVGGDAVADEEERL